MAENLESEDFNTASFPQPGDSGDAAHLGSSESSFSSSVARMRAAAGIYDSEPVPAAPDASTGSPASPAPLILNTGTIGANFHKDPYLFDPGEFSWPTPSKNAENCGAAFRAVRACGCGCGVVRDHCDRKTCANPYCEGVNRDRRAGDIEDKMEAGRKGRAVIYTVFTVPPHLRGKFRDKKLWKKAIDRLLRYMKAELALEYAVERTDPCGEDRLTWHPHINLLWIRKDGRGFISPDSLDALKARWKWIIGERADAPVSVYTQFSTDLPKLRHWYSYMGRTWPEWEEDFPYHCRIKWLGKCPKKPERVKDNSCAKCGLEVALVRVGTQEEAEALAARGYEHVLAEQHARLDELRKMARRRKRVSPSDFAYRVTAEGTRLVRSQS